MFVKETLKLHWSDFKNISLITSNIIARNIRLSLSPEPVKPRAEHHRAQSPGNPSVIHILIWYKRFLWPTIRKLGVCSLWNRLNTRDSATCLRNPAFLLERYNISTVLRSSHALRMSRVVYNPLINKGKAGLFQGTKFFGSPYFCWNVRYFSSVCKWVDIYHIEHVLRSYIKNIL